MPMSGNTKAWSFKSAIVCMCGQQPFTPTHALQPSIKNTIRPWPMHLASNFEVVGHTVPAVAMVGDKLGDVVIGLPASQRWYLS